jgi:hypothetical protein
MKSPIDARSMGNAPTGVSTLPHIGRRGARATGPERPDALRRTTEFVLQTGPFAATIPGIDDATFQAIATKAKVGAQCRSC